MQQFEHLEYAFFSWGKAQNRWYYLSPRVTEVCIKVLWVPELDEVTLQRVQSPVVDIDYE